MSQRSSAERAVQVGLRLTWAASLALTFVLGLKDFGPITTLGIFLASAIGAAAFYADANLRAETT